MKAPQALRSLSSGSLQPANAGFERFSPRVGIEVFVVEKHVYAALTPSVFRPRSFGEPPGMLRVDNGRMKTAV
jgi:hypothetical protein